MDTSTGHLVDDIDDVEEAQRAKYDRIPPALQDEARRELAGRNETVVDVRGDSKLAKWARKRREDRKRSKARRRTALEKASRRRNRGK